MPTKEVGKLQGLSSKYHNVRCEVNGIKLDSKAEAVRYQELVLMLKAGVISGLRVHPRYVLLYGFITAWGRRHRDVVYEGDFEYMEGGRTIVEDVKGVVLPVFRIKAAWLEWQRPDLELRIMKV